MSFDPPLPCHYFMHGAGKYGLQCMTNLDLLPPTGAVIVCPPLKIVRPLSGWHIAALATRLVKRDATVLQNGKPDPSHDFVEMISVNVS